MWRKLPSPRLGLLASQIQVTKQSTNQLVSGVQSQLLIPCCIASVHFAFPSNTTCHVPAALPAVLIPKRLPGSSQSYIQGPEGKPDGF
jgi:hypothetical protein